MFSYRKRSIKNDNKHIQNGYILLCTLFIGILCITVAMCCFSYEMSIKKSNKYSNDLSDISVKREEYKEHLFTYLNSYINENIKNLNKENIKNHFIENEGKLKFEYENSYIIYDKKSDCFVEIYPRDKGILEKDYYSYEVEKNNMILIFSHSEYVKEKL